jgi:hypothetical protein
MRIDFDVIIPCAISSFMFLAFIIHLVTSGYQSRLLAECLSKEDPSKWLGCEMAIERSRK